jgi:hypothetical protein
MKRLLKGLMCLAWFGVCVAALAAAHTGYEGAADWKMEEALGFEMMVLTFPSSMLVVIGFMLVGFSLGLFGLHLPASSRAEMTVTWGIFVTFGYMQWSFGVPWLFSWLRQRFGRTPS